MNATQQLHELGQSLWLGSIPRAFLTSGALDGSLGEIDAVSRFPDGSAGHGVRHCV